MHGRTARASIDECAQRALTHSPSTDQGAGRPGVLVVMGYRGRCGSGLRPGQGRARRRPVRP
jgi:hypothetical protein